MRSYRNNLVLLVHILRLLCCTNLCRAEVNIKSLDSPQNDSLAVLNNWADHCNFSGAISRNQSVSASVSLLIRHRLFDTTSGLIRSLPYTGKHIRAIKDPEIAASNTSLRTGSVKEDNLLTYSDYLPVYVGKVTRDSYSVSLRSPSAAHFYLVEISHGVVRSDPSFHLCSTSRNPQRILTNSSINFTWILKDVPENQQIIFRVILFDKVSTEAVGSITANYKALKDCILNMKASSGFLSRPDFPVDFTSTDSRELNQCSVMVIIPASRTLHLELKKLKTTGSRPSCDQGIHWETNENDRYRAIRSFCGQISDYPLTYRRWTGSGTRGIIRYSWSNQDRDSFVIKFDVKGPCSDVLFTQKISDIEIRRQDFIQGSECTFKIHFPFGYRILMDIDRGTDNMDLSIDTEECLLLAQTKDQDRLAATCLMNRSGRSSARIDSLSNQLTVQLLWIDPEPNDDLVLRIDIEPIEDTRFTDGCGGFPWIGAGDAVCIGIFDEQIDWQQSRSKCRQENARLVSIDSEYMQDVIEELISNSPHFEPSKSYWIGASDRIQETIYHWDSGKNFKFAKWFPGWPEFDGYNMQPSDDGSADEDCVEIRQTFAQPMGRGFASAAGFFWNDRHCGVANSFVCEKPRNTGSSLSAGSAENCSRSISLNRYRNSELIDSPNYPGLYPNGIDCSISISVPENFSIVLDFLHFDLEDDEECSYDLLEVTEEPRNHPYGWKHCGNWKSRLKLLKYRSNSNTVRIRFVSDHSYAATGFRIAVTIEKRIVNCLDHHGGNCYQIVPFPEVTWEMANQLCRSYHGELLVSENEDELNFLSPKLQSNVHYNATSFYWIGQKNKLQLSFSVSETASANQCPVLRLSYSPAESSLQRTSTENCHSSGGFVCKKSSEGGLSRNWTARSSRGEVKSPNYPDTYPDQIHFRLHMTANSTGRLVVHFHHIDLEYQEDCLYDYIGLQSTELGPTKKLCGTHTTNMDRLDFLSDSNEAWLTFHSDNSNSGKGFHASWSTVNISECAVQNLTLPEGEINSPKLPLHYSVNLDCHYTISAPEGTRILLWFESFQVGSSRPCKEDFVRLFNGLDSHILCGSYDSRREPLHFVSASNKMTIQLRTGTSTAATREFHAKYRFEKDVDKMEIPIYVKPNAEYHLKPVNYPSRSTAISYRVYMETKPGFILQIRNPYSAEGKHVCVHKSGFEIQDPYSDISRDRRMLHVCKSDKTGSKDLYIRSYLNVFRLFFNLEFLTGDSNVILVNSVKDLKFAEKLNVIEKTTSLESCYFNPCENGGSCVFQNGSFACVCTSGWKGLFCTLPLCDSSPCVHGRCAMQSNSWICLCDPGYTGLRCEKLITPCDLDPCHRHGDCLMVGNSYECRCHPGWQGLSCENRKLHIPYKPLSQRMLEEPFWLGLITIAGMLVFIGLVCCVKRHLPDKIEGFFTSPSLERAKLDCGTDWRLPPLSHRSSLDPSSNLKDLEGSRQSQQEILVQENSSKMQSILTRLTLRKPSILSTTSLLSPGVQSNASSGGRNDRTRTFSLDDLFRISKRSSSPCKTRYSDMDVALNQREREKHQILQRLVSPQVQVREPLHLQSGQMNTEESTDTDFTTDHKLEKRVTFARMLKMVSAEITSSGSDLSSCDIKKLHTPSEARLQSKRRWNTRRAFRNTHSQSSPSDNDAELFSMDNKNSILLNLPVRSRHDKLVNSSAESLFQNRTPSPQGSDADISSAPQSTPGSPVISGEVAGADNLVQVAVLGNRSSNLTPGAPFITLEIPSASYGHFLSPIREVPSPLPSPCIRRLTKESPCEKVSLEDSAKPQKLRPPLLNIVDSTFKRFDKIEAPERNITIPVVCVSEASPPALADSNSPLTWDVISIGSPPVKKASEFLKSKEIGRSLAKIKADKSNSLDLSCVPPIITVTANYSEAESDADILKNKDLNNKNQMSYLSPYAGLGARINDITSSESNLSSSGYSSLTSPGPSLSGSSKNLLENDDLAFSSRIPISRILKDDVRCIDSDGGIQADQEPVEILKVEDISENPFKDNEGNRKKKSPVSSRSESPLSDTKCKFSQQFYGMSRADLPYTDSDGLYDYPSSEAKPPESNNYLRRATKRRDRKAGGSKKLLEPERTRCTPSKRKNRHPGHPADTVTTSSSNDSLSASTRTRLNRCRKMKMKPPLEDFAPSPSCDIVLTIQEPTTADDSVDEVTEEPKLVKDEPHRVLKALSRVRLSNLRQRRLRQEFAKRRSGAGQSLGQLPNRLTVQDSNSSAGTDGSNDSSTCTVDIEDSVDSINESLAVAPYLG